MAENSKPARGSLQASTALVNEEATLAGERKAVTCSTNREGGASHDFACLLQSPVARLADQPPLGKGTSIKQDAGNPVLNSPKVAPKLVGRASSKPQLVAPHTKMTAIDTSTAQRRLKQLKTWFVQS